MKSTKEREQTFQGRETDAIRQKTPHFVYGLTVLTAISGFMYGYDTGAVAGGMLLLKSAFELSHEWQALLISMTVGAAAFFALIGGYLADVFGRRTVIFTASFVATIGSLIFSCAQNRTMLIAGRFIIGAGIGMATMASPLYIAEIAPAHLRGRLVAANHVLTACGQCVAGIISGSFSYLEKDGWRFIFGMAILPAAVQFFGFCFIPESPRWLIEHGRSENAKTVLARLRGSQTTAEQEYAAAKQAYEDGEKERVEKGGKSVVMTVLKTPHLRRALIVGCLLQLFQQFSGINTVMYYSATIVRMSGVKNTHLAIWLACLLGSVNFICAFMGLYLVEKIGRRLLTLGSLLFVTLSLVLLGVAFNLMALHSPPVTVFENDAAAMANDETCVKLTTCDGCAEVKTCGYCFYENASKTHYQGSCLPTDSEKSDRSLAGRCDHLLSPREPLTWAYDWCPSNYVWLAVLGMVAYLMAFAPGLGPMPMTINSEIYPQWARSTGNAFATSVNWTGNLLVSTTFLSLIEAVGKQVAYYIYASITFAGLIFVFLFLPETKNKTLEELECLFVRPWFNGKNHFGFGPKGDGVQYVHIRGHNKQFYGDDDDDELMQHAPD